MRAMPEVRAWVPMSDGVKLAGTFFLPDSGGPFPVILEALPYRKDDLTASYFHEYRRLRDEGGYAVARIDVRGTGSSQGLAVDEYPAQEQKDLCEVIAWLAAQEWCSARSRLVISLLRSATWSASASGLASTRRRL